MTYSLQNNYRLYGIHTLVVWIVEGSRTDQAFTTTESCHNTVKNLYVREESNENQVICTSSQVVVSPCVKARRGIIILGV